MGQGISTAVGIAMGNKVHGKDSYTYCIVGDGEIQEGQVWEACESATHFKLDHFILFVDWNKKQLDGRLEDVCEPLDIEAKFRAFGFDARTVKGYDVKAIYDAIQTAKDVTGKPHVIVLDTIKGLGVNFAEEKEMNHYLLYGEAETNAAIAEIEDRYAKGTYPGGDFKW